MKKIMFLLVLMTSVSVSFAQTWQQTWSELSKEEKMEKMRSYRDDNQKFLKDSLGMTKTQLKSIDSVNSMYLDGLNKIEKSPASDDEKLAKAQEITKKRSVDLDNIMGEEKHRKFTLYITAKLQKAQG